MNKKFLLTVVAGSFILAMILVGCGADATTGTSTKGIVTEPSGSPTEPVETSSSSGTNPSSSASEGAFCYVPSADYCYSMSEYSITTAQCTDAGGSVVSSCN